MSRPIQVGDLVLLVRWPCCRAHPRLGVPFLVGTFIRADSIICALCGQHHAESLIAAEEGPRTLRLGAPPSWLKRIPPLEELEGEETEEELWQRIPRFRELVKAKFAPQE